VNQTEISQILAEVVFSAKDEELEQAYKSENEMSEMSEMSEMNEEPETAPKSPEDVPDTKEVKSGGCYENRPALKACGTQCFSASNRGRCARRCLKRRFGMSANCANCFGDKISCTIKKCLPKCAGNSEAWKCINCVRSKCGRCNMNKSGQTDQSEGEDMSDEVLTVAVEIATADSKDSEEVFYP